MSELNYPKMDFGCVKAGQSFRDVNGCIFNKIPFTRVWNHEWEQQDNANAIDDRGNFNYYEPETEVEVITCCFNCWKYGRSCQITGVVSLPKTHFFCSEFSLEPEKKHFKPKQEENK